MAGRGLTSREIEQIFEGFEKRQDDKFKRLEERVVNQFHIISEGLKDEIRLVAEGHAGIKEKLDRIEKENERQHMETRSLIKLSFTELDRRISDLESQVRDLQEWRKRVETRFQV